jgi:hypothetical protein
VAGPTSALPETPAGAQGSGAAVTVLSPLAPRLLTTAQAAQYLGVGPDTVYELVTRGVLRRVRIPAPPTAKRSGAEVRKVLLDRQDLDAQIDAWRAEGAS